jgi:hypothetical protein
MMKKHQKMKAETPALMQELSVRRITDFTSINIETIKDWMTKMKLNVMQPSV